MAFSAQAQTTNICDRTEQVRDTILSRTSTEGDTCESVLESEMASISGTFSLARGISSNPEGISSLKEGDFKGLVGIEDLELASNYLTELPTGIFSGLSELRGVGLRQNLLETLPPGVFLGPPKLTALELSQNSLNMIPRAVLSILPNLSRLGLIDNPIKTLPRNVFRGATSLTRFQISSASGRNFQLTVRFSSSQLTKNFTTASVWVVLRDGAPRPVTVPISATGATLSVDKLSIATGNVRSDTAVTVTRTPGGEPFKLSQGEPELGGDNSRYSGFEIVPGPSVDETTFTHLKVRVFLEGALE